MAEDFLDDGLMPPGSIYTARYPMAMAYAATKHAAQRRKDDAGTPYISHPVAVSVLVWQFGDNSDLAADDLEDLAIAGLLHDIAEDAGGEASLGEIRAMFGERVAQIVALASDALPAPGEAKAPWRERKEKHVATMRRLGHGDEEMGLLPDPGACLVIGCDKADNLGQTAEQVAAIGPSFLERFNGGVAGTRWYYRTVRNALAPSLPGGLVRRLDEGLDVIGA